MSAPGTAGGNAGSTGGSADPRKSPRGAAVGCGQRDQAAVLAAAAAHRGAGGSRLWVGFREIQACPPREGDHSYALAEGRSTSDSAAQQLQGGPVPVPPCSWCGPAAGLAGCARPAPGPVALTRRVPRAADSSGRAVVRPTVSASNAATAPPRVRDQALPGRVDSQNGNNDVEADSPRNGGPLDFGVNDRRRNLHSPSSGRLFLSATRLTREKVGGYVADHGRTAEVDEPELTGRDPGRADEEARAPANSPAVTGAGVGRRGHPGAEHRLPRPQHDHRMGDGMPIIVLLVSSVLTSASLVADFVQSLLDSVSQAMPIPRPTTAISGGTPWMAPAAIASYGPRARAPVQRSSMWTRRCESHALNRRGAAAPNSARPAVRRWPRNKVVEALMKARGRVISASPPWCANVARVVGRSTRSIKVEKMKQCTERRQRLRRQADEDHPADHADRLEGPKPPDCFALRTVAYAGPSAVGPTGFRAAALWKTRRSIRRILLIPHPEERRVKEQPSEAS
ncbi:hypothetical protein FQA39_LY18634 [Lamprigera yunnana]|nr:hypothetical protein FQA39_LY18634 [Lamprigera yunnana]